MIFILFFVKKDDILAEQKRLMQQVYEEKRKIAEDKAQFNAKLQSYKDQQHKDSISNLNIEAEISVNSKHLNEERVKLEKLEKAIKEQEEQIKKDKSLLDDRRREFDIREARIEQIAISIQQKFAEADNLFKVTKMTN